MVAIAFCCEMEKKKFYFIINAQGVKSWFIFP